jgi:Protein of unknown function (DUF1376)
VTVELPAPLVPAEVDLRGLEYMPLMGDRLFSSDFNLDADDTEFRVGLRLWWQAWKQVPAGSLPSEERRLCKLAGLEEAPAKWKRVRHQALHGFVQCADGRLYHPIIAQQALIAWEKRAEHVADAAGAADRKRRDRMERKSMFDDLRAAGITPAWDIKKEDLRRLHSERVTAPVTPPVTVTGHDQVTPPVTVTVTAKTGRYETGQLKPNTSLLPQAPALRPEDRPPAPPQLSLVDPPSAKPKGPPDCPHQAVLALWEEVLPSLPQHLPSQWRGARADHLRARWRETAVAKGWTDEAQGLAYLRRLFAHIGRSTFLTGKAPTREPGKRPFVIELEWLVNPTNWAKVHEGKYHEEATA